MTCARQATVLDSYRPVVVGVDDSDQSRAALCWAAARAREGGAELLMVHAYRVPVVSAWHTVPLLLRVEFSQCEEAAQAMLDRLEAKCLSQNPGITVRRLVEPGLARDLLVQASRGAQLLVLGQHRHHHLRETLAGSASGSIQRAHCPVVVVPRVDTDRDESTIPSRISAFAYALR